MCDWMKWKFLFLSFLVTFAVTTGLASAASYDLIIVRADKLPDYGVISPYANEKDIPIIFLEPDEIPEDVERVLRSYQENGYTELLIIGGKSAISQDVQNRLEGMGFNTQRLWDWNRYGTAGRVAVDLWGSSKEAVVTNGEDLQNLLVAQRYSLKKGLPILFTKNGEIPDSTSSAIAKTGVEKVYIFGESASMEHLGVESVRMDLESIDFQEEPEDQDLTNVYTLIGLVVVLVVVSLFLVRYYQKQRKVPYEVLTEDERKVVDIILGEGRVEQQKLPGMTGFSRPKVSRVVNDLKERDILERERRKKTYLVSLKRSIEK